MHIITDSVRKLGSSPLTRGKHRCRAGSRRVRRLIPAHAGKTGERCRSLRCRPAHPRSRGENSANAESGFNVAGSSPLTRGKPVSGDRAHEGRRLIPAHAGKTASTVAICPALAAHPRSRGENSVGGLRSLPQRGSSPLTRGKRERRIDRCDQGRLIPAHAGKTRSADAAELRVSAHPRSRGENSIR